jgi:hypothetical protein
MKIPGIKAHFASASQAAGITQVNNKTQLSNKHF